MIINSYAWTALLLYIVSSHYPFAIENGGTARNKGQPGGDVYVQHNDWVIVAVDGGQTEQLN